jgi:hypothetical protein
VSEGTTGPHQVGTEEKRALVTVEVAERLAVRAQGAIAAGKSDLALHLLEELTAATTSRTATAVKDADLSDEISLLAGDQVLRAVARVAQAARMTGQEEKA